MAHSDPLTFDMSCLYSTVKNTSGRVQKFGFLPPHGRELAVDEEFTVFGHITEAMIRFERVTDKRHIDALQRAIDRGDLTVLNTPNPILQDINDDTVKMIQLDTGALTVVDACWTVSL